MEQEGNRLSLDQLLSYRIRVPEKVDLSHAEWADELTILYEDDPAATIMIGKLDQAGLHGLLRRLYSLGLPLISVINLDHWSADNP